MERIIFGPDKDSQNVVTEKVGIVRLTIKEIVANNSKLKTYLKLARI
ncbi:hypothetical protein L2089_13820 [Paenibacillus hunanensis]|nr:hypothetical protein [Paenibacillus hunanensis]MCL9661774.1 hypothetical protein [Paenibacillus hunanensis]